MNEISNLPQIESSGKLPTICQKRLEWDWMPVKMLENRLLTEVTTKKDWIMLNPPERLKHNRRELGSCKQTYFSQKHTKHKCWMGFKGTWSTREAFPEWGGGVWDMFLQNKNQKKLFFWETSVPSAGSFFLPVELEESVLGNPRIPLLSNCFIANYTMSISVTFLLPLTYCFYRVNVRIIWVYCLMIHMRH